MKAEKNLAGVVVVECRWNVCVIVWESDDGSGPFYTCTQTNGATHRLCGLQSQFIAPLFLFSVIAYSFFLHPTSGDTHSYALLPRLGKPPISDHLLHLNNLE